MKRYFVFTDFDSKPTTLLRHTNDFGFRSSLLSLGIIGTSSILLTLTRSLLGVLYPSSWGLLTLTKDLVWLLEGLPYLSLTSPKALGLISATSILGLCYALATINHYQSSVTKLSD